MRFLKLLAIICFAFLSSAICGDGPPVGEKAEGRITLLGSLEEWKYPGSNMPQGATMSGNGPYPPMRFVMCRTVLTTPDSLEKVVGFYTKKFGLAENADQSDKSLKGDVAQAVFVQDDSKDRPVGVRVFTVNRAKTSTTFVISRADGEKQTHIVWSHFIRLGELP
jgi:hypothetical protein